jgi:hypothetical protein
MISHLVYLSQNKYKIGNITYLLLSVISLTLKVGIG